MPDHRCIAEPRPDLVHQATAQPYFAAGGSFQASDHAQSGGLAAAAWTHDGDELALIHREVDPVHRGGFAESLLKLSQRQELLWQASSYVLTWSGARAGRRSRRIACARITRVMVMVKTMLPIALMRGLT